MKKIYSYAFAASVLMLASCSNESEPVVNGGNEASGEAQYLTVNICTPNNATRATDFEAGTDGENYAENALFLVVDGDGTIQQHSSENLEPWSDLAEDDNNVARISSATLVINKAEDKPTATHILAILNCPKSVSDAINDNSTKVADVMKMTADYVTEYQSDGNFIMTNSSYLDANTDATAVLNLAVIDEKNICKTAEAAKNSPVQIYVERLAAKVKTSADSKFNESNTEVLTYADGTEAMTVYRQIKGVEIANVAKKSYLVKQLENEGSLLSNPLTIGEGTWNWNDVKNFRSYWAVSPELKAKDDYYNKSWTNIGTNDLNNAFYIQENAENQGAQTAVLVTAQFTEDEAGETPVTFFRIASQMYTEAGAKKQLAGMFIESSDFRYAWEDAAGNKHYATLPVEAFNWKDLTTIGDNKYADERLNGVDEGWEVRLTFGSAKGDNIPGEATLVKWNRTTREYDPATSDDVEKALCSKEYRAWKWTNGCAYYYVNINNEHLDGVVRNHVYDLTLNSITGFGVPVANPDETIIPNQPKEDQLFYLAAKINILEWKIVKQTVNFGHDYK